jgi:hypothetical protein
MLPDMKRKLNTAEAGCAGHKQPTRFPAKIPRTVVSGHAAAPWGYYWGYRKKIDLIENGVLRDLARFIKPRQRWIEHSEHRVVIPYGQELAEHIPPLAVRLRRDFGQLLALIRAHAILHQASRQPDAEQGILATLDHYAVLRDLVVAAIAEGIEATVSPTVRETVSAVQGLLGEGGAEATLQEIAAALKLDKSAASRPIAAAIQLGTLRNLQERKGRPARVCLGEQMPEEVPVLPLPEVLQCCGVARGV